MDGRDKADKTWYSWKVQKVLLKDFEALKLKNSEELNYSILFGV